MSNRLRIIILLVAFLLSCVLDVANVQNFKDIEIASYGLLNGEMADSGWNRNLKNASEYQEAN